MSKKLRYCLMLFFSLLTLSVSLGIGSEIFPNPIYSDTVVQAETVTSSLQPKLNQVKSKMKISSVTYGNWSTTNVLSTRFRRVTGTALKAISGALLGQFSKIANYITIGSIAFDILDAARIQGPNGGDVWPTVKTRFILGKTARGTDMILGEETYLTLYGDSSRAKVVAKSHFYFWLY
ncbi:hypothetical protein Q7W37_12055 [Streptococcus suis]|nr:hypothetical protein [Streptococcus suis]